MLNIHHTILIFMSLLSTDEGSVYNTDINAGEKQPRTKRVRTTFSDEQVEILQVNFNLDCNPDGQDLERIARITGLSKRVTQVIDFSILMYRVYQKEMIHS